MAPSLSPVITRIRQNIVTTMQGINGDPDYFTFVPPENVFVVRNAAMLDNPTVVPSIYIASLGADIDSPKNKTSPYEINQLFSHGMYGVIRLYTNVRSDSINEIIEKFVRDVHVAFSLDRTRGGNAVHSKIAGYELIYPADESDGIGGADLPFEVWYRTLKTNMEEVH